MKSLYPGMEFHVSRRARDLYRFDETIFSLSGNAIFANFRAARLFAQKINGRRDLVAFPEQAIKPGQIIAMGLVDEVLHYVVRLFREEMNGNVMGEVLAHLDKTVGRDRVNSTLSHFTDGFPPLQVYRSNITVDNYLAIETNQVPHRQIALEEMLLLWLANMNPAVSPFLELFDDTDLKRSTAYLDIMGSLRKFFDTQPPFGPYSQQLVEMLRSPAIAVPHSLPGQIDYIREHWGFLLRTFLLRLLGSLDLLKEEEKLTFTGPGRAQVYKYEGLELESEHFSPDSDWMPRLVLMAKNIYVWLHQLSKKYGSLITHLDQIPDNELVLLKDQGFTGLWLIGIWERSPASQKIKQMCGNPEAVPSAYSLFDYTIADDIGGEEAYKNLRDRAWERGIRLASDMVPNHMGIFSQWVVEHPDWFVSVDQNPFPWYTYDGPDLSTDERVAVFLENHYYTRSDAAVVFKRTDRFTGSEQYVYHGNDGTSMPWNDTAQLNYLNPEVREAMIQTILQVARKFPVIRFDAAMTLTKRHYQRLWFPEPGTGGAIPTRSEHGLTKEAFNQVMPHEFWREVVDRVAAEAPDTLLLAEAFWLLEGYFVRTLGMHRVYNSAFMNMLRDEENSKYRTVIKNTLEFDPEVLRRFVNFMNNPDERTTVDQFGKDSKYFCICTLLATTPGLPMFGHGQLEGFGEKYGMEYRRAYWDEEPDGHLIRRHEREIFPLLHRRHVFAGVENFLLYDFFTTEGHVNEDVFAYSNKDGEERALVLCHNRDARTAGWIRMSAAYAAKEGGSSNPQLVRKSLGQGLGLVPSANRFLLFRDHGAGLEFIRNSGEVQEKGFFFELGQYSHHVFMDFREIEDNEWHHYASLSTYLGGRGVPSIEEALQEVFLQPIRQRFKGLAVSPFFQRALAAYRTFSADKTGVKPADLLNDTADKSGAFLLEIRTYVSGERSEAPVALQVKACLEVLLSLPSISQQLLLEKDVGASLSRAMEDESHLVYTALGWLFVHSTGEVLYEGDEASEQSRSWIDEWRLSSMLSDLFIELGMDEGKTVRMMALVKLMTAYQDWFRNYPTAKPHDLLDALLSDSEVQQFIKINRYRGLLWFNKESYGELAAWLLIIAILKLLSQEEDISKARVALEDCSATLHSLLVGAEKAGYQVEKLIDLMSPKPVYTSSQESE